MQDPDYIFEDVIDLVSEQYGLCVRKAREMFNDEAVVQSASATMFINASKERTTVARYLSQLGNKIAKIDSEAIPSAIKVWEWHFKDFLNELGPRLRGYLVYCVNRGDSPEEIEMHIKERVFNLRCEKLSKEEQDSLGKQMFGDAY